MSFISISLTVNWVIYSLQYFKSSKAMSYFLFWIANCMASFKAAFMSLRTTSWLISVNYTPSKSCTSLKATSSDIAFNFCRFLIQASSSPVAMALQIIMFKYSVLLVSITKSYSSVTFHDFDNLKSPAYISIPLVVSFEGWRIDFEFNCAFLPLSGSALLP